MRRILFIIIALALKSCLYAQDDYRPFVEEGKTWNYYVEATTNWWDGKETHLETEYVHTTLTINGDTVINGKNYKKVILDSDNDFIYTFRDTSTFVFGVIREENKKVYFINYFLEFDTDYFPERLIYDFGLNMGDCFVENYGNDYWVMNMELMSIKEKNDRRIFTFSAEDKFSNNYNENPIMIWVEGGGGYHGLGLEQILPILTCFDCTRYTFLSLSCYLGDECLCAFDEKGNLVSGIEEIKVERERIIKEGIYDLQGRQLKEEPTHSIYIKDGKKIAR